MLIVGIDPGISGGIACLSPDGAEAEPMPLVGTEIDAGYLADWLITRSPALVVVEKVGAMPGNGSVSMFKFGTGFGQILGVLEALKLSHYRVTPQAWKKAVLAGTSRDKTAAIEYVHRRYPDVCLTPGRKRTPHDGMADALCLAEYGRTL